MSACSVPIIPAISRSATPKHWLDCCSGSKAIAGSSRCFAVGSRGGRRCSDRNARSRLGGGCLPNFRHNPDLRLGASWRNQPANNRVMFVVEGCEARPRSDRERSSSTRGRSLTPAPRKWRLAELCHQAVQRRTIKRRLQSQASRLARRFTSCVLSHRASHSKRE